MMLDSEQIARIRGIDNEYLGRFIGVAEIASERANKQGYIAHRLIELLEMYREAIAEVSEKEPV